MVQQLVERGHAVDLLFEDPVCAGRRDDIPAGVRLFCVTREISLRELAARQRELDQSEVFSGATVIPRPRRWRSWYWSLVTRNRPLFIEEELARKAFKVAGYLDRERPDAVLCMGHYSAVGAAYARDLSRHRARMVATLNGRLVPRLRPGAGYAYSRVDAVVAVSRGVARFAANVLGVRVPVHTVYSPLVDADSLRNAAEPPDHPWFGGDVPVILSAGRLEKDYPTLLYAVALLSARRPVRLIVLGEGEKAARLHELQALAQSLGIAGSVDFAGFAANPLAYMARADLFVLSSNQEGMPQVLVQAMMVGCRMVATDCDFGPAELLGGEEYGRLAPVGDAARLAEAMDRELDTPRDPARLRARAAELFDVERSIDAYEAMLETGGGGADLPSVGRLRKLLPIPTVAVWALGLILVGVAGLHDAARWWIVSSGLLLVGLVAAKESILWRWRRDQLREELAGERRRAEQAPAAERKQAEQALATALSAERKRTVGSGNRGRGVVSRVAILCWSLRGGGVQRTMLTIVQRLVKRGYAVDLLFQDPKCAWRRDDIPAGVRLFCVTGERSKRKLAARQRELDQSEVLSGATVIPHPAVSRWQRKHASVALACRWRSWYWWLVTRNRPLFIKEELARKAFRVAGYLDRERPDAVLCIGHYSTGWAAYARDLSWHRVRMVATLNGWLLPAERREWAAYAYSRMDAVMAVSRDVARFADADVLGVRVPVHTVYSPLVDADRLRNAAEPPDHPWFGGDVPVILSAGRLEKDYPPLLRAVALLSAHRPVRLIVLGVAAKKARLRELQVLAQSLGIAGSVDFAGFVTNPLAYMARADLFVLSSEHEGMPQVLVQAMMVGCRMVATDCDFGPAELLGGGEYGRLVPVGDAARLAEAMDRELDTPRDPARLRARAAELFDVERSIDAYEAMLGTGGGGTDRPSVGRLRKLLPIPTVALVALGLNLVGAGLFFDAASRWWIGASGLALVWLVGAKESILWRWRRAQLREDLAGQRRRAEQALAAERKRAEQALATALAAERKRAEQALANAERKRIVASRQTKMIADLHARSAATQKQKKPPGDEQNAGVTPRRIAVLTASLGGGGAERVALTIARGLAGRGHDVDLLLGEVKCDYPEEAADAAANNVRFFSVYPDTPGPEAARPHGGGAGRTWRTAIRPEPPDSRIAPPLAASPLQRPVLESPWPERARLVAAYIDRERPDALLAVNVYEAVSAALARRLARHPVRMVATLNNGVVNDRRIRNFRASYPFVDVAVGVSRGISGVLADVAGVPRGRIRTIHDPVFSPELLEKAAEPVSHPWLGGDVPVVVTAASLLVKKDYPTLLRAFSRLVSRRPARLVALGEGVLLAELRTLTRELGIEGHVDFAGFVRNPFAYMARADLFVLSSRFEGLPGVLIQAMATGCPVVSTDCPHGPAEILEHGKYGPLVPVGDAAALAEAMRRTLDAPPDADALRTRAAFFSVDRSIESYEAQLAAGAPGAQ